MPVFREVRLFAAAILASPALYAMGSESSFEPPKVDADNRLTLARNLGSE